MIADVDREERLVVLDPEPGRWVIEDVYLTAQRSNRPRRQVGGRGTRLVAYAVTRRWPRWERGKTRIHRRRIWTVPEVPSTDPPDGAVAWESVRPGEPSREWF